MSIGTLAATESGLDTFASTGKVHRTGNMAALSSGTDTAAITGDVIVQGVLAAVEPADGAAVAGSCGGIHAAGTTYGTPNTYLMDIEDLTTYTELLSLSMRIHATNTGSATLNINGLGAILMVLDSGAEIPSGYLLAKKVYPCSYDAGLNRLVVHIQIVGPITVPATVTNILYSGYQREAIANLVINDDDEILVDWTAAAYFNYTNTREHTIRFSNYPAVESGFGQTILLTIRNPGAHTIIYGEGETYQLEVDEEQVAGGILPPAGKCKILSSCCELDTIFLKYIFSIVDAA